MARRAQDSSLHKDRKTKDFLAGELEARRREKRG